MNAYGQYKQTSALTENGEGFPNKEHGHFLGDDEIR